MFIQNQDHDAMYEYDPSKPLYAMMIFTGNDIYLGTNLYYSDGKLLGTFDNFIKAENEIHRIRACKKKVYCISGFCDYGLKLRQK